LNFFFLILYHYTSKDCTISIGVSIVLFPLVKESCLLKLVSVDTYLLSRLSPIFLAEVLKALQLHMSTYERFYELRVNVA